MKKIEVRPIEVKKWHNKRGEESFKRPIRIGALVNKNTRVYDTGLTDEEAEKFGKLLKVDLSTAYNPDQAHPFWDTKQGTIKLENNTMVFNPDQTLDLIKIRIMKQSPFVANSLKAYEDGEYPHATHVIFDESEEVEVKATKVAIRKKATIESASLSKDRKIQIIMILAGKNLKGKSDDFVEVELDKLISAKARDVLNHIQMDSEDITIHSLVLECLQKNVINKKGINYRYMDSVIGSDIYDVIDYLKNDENQDFKLRLMAAVNN